MHNLTFLWLDRDVMKVAVGCFDGGRGHRIPEGRDGDSVVMEDENIESADECLGSRR